MPRTPLLACVAALLVGCGPVPPAHVARLQVLLPEFTENLEADPPRRAMLKADGKEQIVPVARSGKSFTVDLEPADGKKTAEVELSFWPVPYSNTFRKKTITLEKGKAVTADMRAADPDRPDHIEAIFVPTPDEAVAEALRLARLTGDDTLLDIGCGDGKVVIEAVKAGAKRAVGVDIRRELVDLSRENARKAGVADRCEFRVEDAFKMKGLSGYTVVFMCLGEDLQTQLMPVLKTMPKGTRIVAANHLIEGWPPDRTARVDIPSRGWKYPVYLWTIK